MAGTIVRELFARLGLDVDDAAFEAGEKAIGALSFRLAAAGAAVAGFGAGLAVAVQRTAAYAMESRNMAATSGIATQRFQQLAYAASTVQFEANDLRDVFLDLSERALDASKGAQEYAQVFRGLGVSVKDGAGKLKNGEALFLEVADAFARMEDGTTKSAYASKLLGEQGARLLPMLNRGRSGIERLSREADALGLVLDERTNRAAEEFNANLSRAQGALRGFAYTIGAEAMPALSALLGRFSDWVVASRTASDGKPSKAIRFLGQVAQKTAQIVEALGWAVFQLAKHWKITLMVLGAVSLALLVVNGELVAGAALAAVMALRGLAVAAAWLKAAAAMVVANLPVFALAAAFFLVALALEDVYTFLQGGDSLLGRFGPKWTAFLESLTKSDDDDWWITTAVKALVWMLTDIATRFPAAIGEWKGMLADFFSFKWLDRTIRDTKFKGFSVEMSGPGQPAADTRQWHTVGGALGVGSGPLPLGPPSITSPAVPAGSGVLAPQLNATVNVTAQTGASAEEIGGMVRQNIEEIWDTKMRESYVLAE